METNSTSLNSLLLTPHPYRAPALPALPAVSSGMSSRLTAVFSDIQFWVPVAVLIAGALILYWVSR